MLGEWVIGDRKSELSQQLKLLDFEMLTFFHSNFVKMIAILSFFAQLQYLTNIFLSKLSKKLAQGYKEVGDCLKFSPRSIEQEPRFVFSGFHRVSQLFKRNDVLNTHFPFSFHSTDHCHYFACFQQITIKKRQFTNVLPQYFTNWIEKSSIPITISNI